MTLLSHRKLVQLAETGVIGPVKNGAINAASIDIHLGDTILWEDDHDGLTKIVDYRLRQPVSYFEHHMDADGWLLQPGDFILAQSRETFNLPNWLSAEYKLKSSMARIGLEHMNAGWCDAGWHGSVLTLELKNMTKHHAIRIRPGDAIGQIVFFEHEEVPADASYAAKGRYNKHSNVMSIVK